MLKKLSFYFSLTVIILTVGSCTGNAKSEDSSKILDNTSTEKSIVIKSENIDYAGDGISMKGFVAYNEALSSLRPVILIVPEWWGISDYTRMRAKQLAALGYVAFAVDFYGEGKTAESPEEAGKLAGPFYAPGSNLAQKRFEAALLKIKTYLQADTTKIAAIGYCFGGAMVLNMARIGEPLKGVVSFHGNLVGLPVQKDLLKADMLICHGEKDQFVPVAEVAIFKKQMDSIGGKYTFKSYANATHAFTNPKADEKAKKYNMPIAYNPVADTASFNDMKIFFAKIFQ